ncbi:DUF456 family protein [Desulfovibrio litoralis]|uniref:DUF456 domain-containing protein n=1 Tax=Desulfovibrio litoralis DSM 11393 TaxID=1121455 RepID=A0A1M7T6Q8_9BACT|nr:DUF456 family protein [Desulfovibrio litoralis]SHN66332.1 hypothetical protein SAMN02745728_01620 [Desulfovibrio litoralis DSM 11393]
MSVFFATIFFVILIIAYLLNILSLPGNWVVIALMLLWFSLTSWTLSTNFFIATIIAATIGEVLEFITQYFASKRYGSSGSGSLGGFIGSIVGAVLGAGFLLGFGALLGGLAGAYLGCLAVEMFKDRPIHEAREAAFGNFLGKFFGLSLKLACGVFILQRSFQVLFA